MKEYKSFRNYISNHSKVLMLVGVLFLLGALLCAGMAVRAKNTALPEAVPFDAMEGETGSYVYLDVIGVSDWVYKYDDTTYYVLEDPWHLYYAAHLTDRQFSSLRHQNRYWNELTSEEIPVRLYGVTLRLTDTMRENYADVFEITKDDVNRYFGYRCFDAGTTPAQEDLSMWSAIAMALLILGLIPLLGGLPNAKAMKLARSRLEQRGLQDAAEEEFASPLTESLCKDRLRMTRRFLFGRGTGLAASWEDVLWCYERVMRTYGVLTGRVLMIGTVDGRLHNVPFGPKDEDGLYHTMELIGEKNPTMLRGFTKENRAEYKRLCKEAKQTLQ